MRVCVKKGDRQTGSLVDTKRICNLSDSKYILKFYGRKRGEDLRSIKWSLNMSHVAVFFS